MPARTSDNSRVTSKLLIALQQSTKDIGTVISTADALLTYGETVAEDKMCAAVTIHQEALIKLVNAIKLYEMWMNLPNAERDSNYKTVKKSRDDALFYALKLKNSIARCKMMDRYPGMNQAINLYKQGQNTPGNKQETEKQEMRVREKILKTILYKPCGFRSFDDYAGGKNFEEFFNKVAVYPFMYDNFSKEQEKMNGILLFGPPGTGKSNSVYIHL